ncbi:MAG: hypothetical protein AAF677_01005 [Pseudomonadota bacterium]
MKLILYLLIPVMALAGAAVAEYLAPPPDETMAAADGADAMADANAEAGEKEAEVPDRSGAASDRRAVPLGRRLVVPVVDQDVGQAVVLFDLAVDVPLEASDLAHQAIPRLRDGFLRTMLTVSAGGAFNDGIADPLLIENLRDVLRARARQILEIPDVEVLMLEVIMRPV